MSRILLVDDDKDMLLLTSRWLEKAGYEVITKTSGIDALTGMSENRPDLVILDYAMPQMDGPAVFEAIKAVESYRDIPIIFRTGKDDMAASDIISKLSPDGVVSKSDGKTALLKAISDLNL